MSASKTPNDAATAANEAATALNLGPEEATKVVATLTPTEAKPAPLLSDDQAEGLRRLQKPTPVRVVCVASGKGGVGKSHITVNLALALAQQGKRVMLFDADLGLANVDVILGLRPVYNLSHVISGQCRLEDVILSGPLGIRIIPASSGIKQMASLEPQEYAGLINAFGELSDSPDLLLIDSAAGISEGVVTFCRASHDVIVVICDEPTAMTDAYALIKVLHKEHQLDRFHIIVNRVPRQQDGRLLFNKLVKVTERFLDVTLNYLGDVPEDPQLRKALRCQRALIDAYPGSRASDAFRRLAVQIERWPLQASPSGHLQFFLERLVQQFAAEEAVS